MKRATQRVFSLTFSIPSNHPCHRKRPLPLVIVYALAALAAIAASYTPAILTDVAIGQEPPNIAKYFGACAPPPAGMAGWWPGDGNANDVQSGYNGTLHNGATFTSAGKVGSAFDFPGTNSYVFAAGTTNIAGGPQATYDAWVHPTTTPAIGNYGSVFGAGDSTQPSWNPQQCRILYYNFAGSPQFYADCGVNNNGSQISRTTTNSYAPGSWYHVAAVVKNGNIDLYVNGVLDNGAGSSIAGASINTLAGQFVWMGSVVRADQAVVGMPFTGLLDEVEIINRALSAGEVAAIYAADAAGKCKPGATQNIPLNGTTRLTLTFFNPNSVETLSGISVVDNFPAGVVVATPAAVTTDCGGTISAPEAGTQAQLDSVTLAAGASCSLALNVTGTTAGTKVNTTSPVQSTEGGAGGTASATLTVVAPPTITKSFDAASLPQSGFTALHFTITNPNLTQGLTGVGFTDNLPSGLAVRTPNSLTGSCGSGTITAVAGATSITLANADLPASGSCTFSVDVTGLTGGTKVNTTGNVNSIEGLTGGTATASIVIVEPPALAKSFTPGAIPVNATSVLSFTVTNPANNSVALENVAFIDHLPPNMVVATPNGLTGSCGGGTITAVAGATSLSLTGATIAASSSCTFSVNVTSAITAFFMNATDPITSSNGGTGNQGIAHLVTALPPQIAKSFASPTVPLNGSVLLTFTITNPSANVIPLTGIAFTDSLPAGLIVATPNGLTSNCGGTVAAVAGSANIALSGGTIPPFANCTVSVNVTGTASGAVINSVSVTSTEAGAGNTSTSSVTVIAPPTVTGVSPSSGLTAGGTSVIITGTNFTGATAVKFGATNASSYTVDSDTQITATSPPGSAGTVDITVTTAAGTSATSASDQFTYLATTVTIPTATGRGDIILTTNSPGCGFSNVQAYTEEQVGGDSLYDYPFGLVGFTLNCGGPADVSLTFTGATDLSGQPYRRHGPTTPGDPSTTRWYTYPDVTIAGNMVTLHNLQNGQFGDDTGVEDGVIVDQGGPGEPAQATPVPTMNEWGMIVLTVLLGIGSVYYLLRRRVENRDTSHFA